VNLFFVRQVMKGDGGLLAVRNLEPKWNEKIQVCVCVCVCERERERERERESLFLGHLSARWQHCNHSSCDKRSNEQSSSV
jgi:hypothetical protein